MTQEEKIVHGNKLIAEFMGLDVLYEDCVRHESTGPHRVTKMKYHSSWDWLMPVVEKIELLNGISIRIEDDFCAVIDIKDNIIVQNNTNSKIESVYLSIVAFIEWDNTQNK